MGGIGVVTSSRNAVYYNPALQATYEEDIDAIALVPVYGESTIDPDDVESELDTLYNAIATSNITQQNLSLSNLTNTVYQHTRINSAAIIIPNELLAGSAYISKFKMHTARPVIGANVAASTLEHRALDQTDIGASAAKIIDLSDIGIGDIQLGINAKIMLFESYGYSEAIAGSGLAFDRNEVRNDSLLNIDVGFVKEMGVWKTGLVVKNLLSDTMQYGNSARTYKIAPQIRAGFAYQSRRALLEFDIDLTENERVGFGKATAYAAAGWEYRLFGRTFIRLGLRQNMVGDKLTTISGGAGIGFFGVIIDVSAMVSEDEKALFANFGYEI